MINTPFVFSNINDDKLYIVLAMFLNKFWDYCCFTCLNSPAGPITFRMIPVLYSEEEEEETYTELDRMEYLSSIVFHTVLLT